MFPILWIWNSRMRIWTRQFRLDGRLSKVVRREVSSRRLPWPKREFPAPDKVLAKPQKGKRKKSSRTVRATPTVRENRADSVAAVVARTDRKSTRLNSSHANISYAVFC